MSGPVLATATHAAALAAAHAASFPPAEAWSAEAIAAQLVLPGCFGLIDATGGMVLARVTADQAEILTIAVAPGARRRGVGAGLLAAAMRHAAGCGATEMFLEVAAGNVPAATLYAAAGFRPAGFRRGYYPDGSDAIVLRATLGRA